MKMNGFKQTLNIIVGDEIKDILYDDMDIETANIGENSKHVLFEYFTQHYPKTLKLIVNKIELYVIRKFTNYIRDAFMNNTKLTEDDHQYILETINRTLATYEFIVKN